MLELVMIRDAANVTRFINPVQVTQLEDAITPGLMKVCLSDRSAFYVVGTLTEVAMLLGFEVSGTAQVPTPPIPPSPDPTPTATGSATLSREQEVVTIVQAMIAGSVVRCRREPDACDLPTVAAL